MTNRLFVYGTLAPVLAATRLHRGETVQAHSCVLRVGGA